MGNPYICSHCGIDASVVDEHLESCPEYAYEHRFDGLDNFQEIEAAMRKLDLAQIGHAMLSTIGEANHSSWDAYTREELEKINYALGELLPAFQNPDWFRLGDGFGFGGEEYWDAEGKRHVR